MSNSLEDIAMDALGEQTIGLFLTKGADYAWEPHVGRNDPRIQQMIEKGWLKPCTLRHGFHELSDTGVTWTMAGAMALTVLFSEASND